MAIVEHTAGTLHHQAHSSAVVHPRCGAVLLGVEGAEGEGGAEGAGAVAGRAPAQGRPHRPRNLLRGSNVMGYGELLCQLPDGPAASSTESIGLTQPYIG
jgi:hypothetical protein